MSLYPHLCQSAIWCNNLWEIIFGGSLCYRVKSFSINKTQIKTLSKRGWICKWGTKRRILDTGLAVVCVCVCVGECFCICVGERHAKHFWLGDALKRATFLTLAHGVYATWTFAPASSAFLNAAINPLTKLSLTSPPFAASGPLSLSLPHSLILLHALTF